MCHRPDSRGRGLSRSRQLSRSNCKEPVCIRCRKWCTCYLLAFLCLALRTRVPYFLAHLFAMAGCLAYMYLRCFADRKGMGLPYPPGREHKMLKIQGPSRILKYINVVVGIRGLQGPDMGNDGGRKDSRDKCYSGHRRANLVSCCRLVP